MRYIIHRGCQCKFLDTGIRKVFEKRFAIEKVIAFYGIRKEQPQTFQIHCHVTWPQRRVGEGGGGVGAVVAFGKLVGGQQNAMHTHI